MLVVGIIGLVAGIGLIVGATSTADFFAWPIAPPQTARFMGAGYLGTGLVLLAGLRVGSWRAVRLIVPPVVVFAITMVAATLMHADRFRWDRAIAWVWLGLYGVIVAGALVVAWLEASQQAAGPPIRLHRGQRVALLLAFLAMAAWAVPLFVQPSVAAAIWPWPLTALTARVVAGWIAVGAVLALVAALADDAAEVWLPAGGWAVAVGLFLAVSLLNLDALASSGILGVIYFVALAVSVVGAVYLAVHSRRLLSAI